MYSHMVIGSIIAIVVMTAIPVADGIKSDEPDPQFYLEEEFVDPQQNAETESTDEE